MSDTYPFAFAALTVAFEGDTPLTAQPALVPGHDRTPQSRYAMSAPTDLATRRTAVLHLVDIVDLRDYPIDPDSADWDDNGRATLADEVARAALAGQPARPATAGIAGRVSGPTTRNAVARFALCSRPSAPTMP